jgi:hypothetical protein
MNSYETMAEREKTLMRLISESRYELQLSALGNRELEATMKAWIRRLSAIPDEHLQRCFVLTLERHTTRSAIIPAQLLDTWAQLREELDAIARQHGEREPCDYACSFEGWITVDAQGRIWTGGEGMTFSKACPIHRPQGWRVGEMTDKNYKPKRQESEIL